MSRIGKQPILLPEKVEVTIDDQTVTIKGPKGELTQTLNPVVQIEETKDDDLGRVLHVSVAKENDSYQRAQWGTARSLLSNLVTGVTDGFEKGLEVNGVGFRVNLSGKTLVLNVGYSHEVKFELPEAIDAKVEDNKITLTSADKQLLGETAAEIRKIRKPEPYKGKGIKYTDEIIRRKVGKTAAAIE